MRKKITLLTLFALGCISYSAMAQSTEQVEMKSRISRERTDGDGNKTYVWEYEYLDNYYYNKEGKNVLYTRYMLEPAAGTKESLYEQTFYEYNSLGQLTKELQKYTDYGYEYDGNGLLVKKSQTGKGGEQMNSWEYTYNKDNQVTEELEKYNGTPNGKTVYRYNTSKQLAVKLVYEDQYPVGFVVKDSIIYTYKNGNIDTRFTYRYPAEGATEPYEKVYNEWKNGTLVADSVYTVDNFDGDTELKPTETKLRPTEKNYYTYDASGKLLSKKSYSYNSQTNNFSVPKGESLYTLNKIGAGYIATGLKVEGTDKPGSVKLTFKAPVQTEGLQGYKVVIDGQLKDDLMIDKSKTEYILEGQTRGEHVYCLVSVYNEIAANMTEEARYSVEINLPQPTNIRLSAYEKTMFGWEITAVWNKPEIPENLHFKNYAVKVVYPTYELPNTTATNQYKFSYYANKDGEEMEIQVATVYEEGTSDYVSFKQPLWENNQLTAHWHNSGKTVKNADGSLNSSIHYYYMANGSSEKLYAEVQCGSTGSPREKITKVVDEAGE